MKVDQRDENLPQCKDETAELWSQNGLCPVTKNLMVRISPLSVAIPWQEWHPQSTCTRAREPDHSWVSSPLNTDETTRIFSEHTQMYSFHKPGLLSY